MIEKALPRILDERKMALARMAPFLKGFPVQARRYLAERIVAESAYAPDLTVVASRVKRRWDGLRLWFDLRACRDAALFVPRTLAGCMGWILDGAQLVVMSADQRCVGREIFLEFDNRSIGLLPGMLGHIECAWGYRCRHAMAQVELAVPWLDENKSFMIGFCFDGGKLARLEIGLNVRRSLIVQQARILGMDYWGNVPGGSRFRGERSWIILPDGFILDRCGWQLSARQGAVLSKGGRQAWHAFGRHAFDRHPSLASTPGWVSQVKSLGKTVQVNCHFTLRMPHASAA